MDENGKSTWQALHEEIQTTGAQLLKEIHRLIAEGNVRKLVIKSSDGHIYLTVPLTAGAVAGGILTVGAPWLALLAALAGLVADVKIEVTREAQPHADAFTKTDNPAPMPPTDSQH